MNVVTEVYLVEQEQLGQQDVLAQLSTRPQGHQEKMHLNDSS